MADPAAAKVTLVSLLGATAVGAASELLVEWVGILLGAGVGGLIACSMSDHLKDSDLWERIKHWGLAALVGAVAAPVAMIAVDRVMGPFNAASGLTILPFVSMLAGGFWRHVASDIPAMWDKWRGK